MLAREKLAAVGRMKMNPRQRQAVAMVAEGYSAPEIARRLNVPVDTVGSYLKRARTAWKRARGKRIG